MKIQSVIAPLALIALPLAACSEQAQQETSEAADAVGDDVARTGDEAWEATQEAAGAARETARDVGQDISEGADAAADETGAALENAGERLRD